MDARSDDRPRAQELVRVEPGRPDGVSSAAFEAWQRSFDTLLAMLKDRADASLDSAGRYGAQRLEHAALNRRGPAGRTLAECAALNSRALPPEIRTIARSLPDSSWQLYDVLTDAEPGVLLRRIHDDSRVVCHGFEGEMGVFAGEVYAMRLLDAGRFVASTLPVHIPSPAVTPIAARLEQEFAARTSGWSWEEYLVEHGSLMILESLEAHAERRVTPGPAVRDPLTSPSQVGIPREHWRRVSRWYRRLTELRSSSRLLRTKLPSGQTADVYGCVAEPVVEVHNKRDRGFLRVWSADQSGAFPEDAEWLEEGGRVILAARQDIERVWHDVTSADIEALIAAMRWIAVHNATGGSKAA